MFGAVWSSDSGFDQGKHAVCGPFWLGILIRVLIRASTRSADLFGWEFRFGFGSGQARGLRTFVGWHLDSDLGVGSVIGAVALCLALWPCVWHRGPVFGAVAL